MSWKEWPTAGRCAVAPTQSAIHRRPLAWGVVSALVVWLAAVVVARGQTPGGFQAYTLRHAQAAAVEAHVKHLLSRSNDKVEIVVDNTNNRLLVNGGETTHTLVRQLLQTLDQPAKTAEVEPVLKAYPIAAEQFAATLADWQAAFRNQPAIRIAGDARSNQVLVLAPPAVHDELARRTAPAEQPTAAAAPATAAKPAVVPAAPVRPSEAKLDIPAASWTGVETGLRELWGPNFAAGTTVHPHLATYQLRTPSGKWVQIDYDRQQQFAVVRGEAGLVNASARVIEALERKLKKSEQRTSVVSLKAAQPVHVRQAVDVVNGDSTAKTPAASDDPSRARIIVGGDGRRVQPFLTMLFQPKPGEQPAAEKTAAAQPVPAKTAAEAAQPAAQPGNQPANQPANPPAVNQPADAQPVDPNDLAGGLSGPVQIEFVEGLDALIITGNPKDVEKVLKIIEDIESLSVDTVPELRIHNLKHVNSEIISSVVRTLYDQVLSSRQGRISITPLVKPNALLLIGRAESIKPVVDLINQLDQPVDPTTQFEVFRLKHAPALSAQTTVQEFFSARTGLGGRVLVVADFRSNSLIIQASPRDLAEARLLIQRIDTPVSEAVNELRVIKLDNSLAEELAPILQEAINSQTGGVGRNQQGRQGNLQNVLQQGPQGFDPNQVQPQQQRTGAQNQQLNLVRSLMLRFMTIDREGRRQVNSGILSDVRITADPRANALLVSAPADSIELIEALVKQLDQIPAARAQIKVFTIVNGDATGLSTMLEGLFGTAQGGGRGGFGNLFQGPQATASGGEGSLVSPLRFTTDTRTNSIIASGTAGDLNIVEAILLKLDDSDVRQRRSTVYRLKNASGQAVATALNEYLRTERQVQQTAPGLLSPFEQIEREVVVVPETVTNSLVISATPRFYDEIMKLVEQLDARPPMVAIQVLIAEVQLNNTDEFGIELGLQDSILFDRSLLGDLLTTTNSTQTSTPAGVVTQTDEIIQAASNTPGFNFNNQPLGNSGSDKSLANSSKVAGQALSSFAVGRLNSELGWGGLVLSASSESVSVLLRALQENRRLEVLNRPQITTLDNQAAFIQVGQRIQRISSTQTEADTGRQINTLTPENVGLILGVTPRVSPDGMIVMEIDAEKSEVGPEAEGIPVSISTTGDVIRSPRINTNTAQTTISAMSGQTIIVGGLISKSKADVHRRVPLLSDIPVLGNLFRYDSVSTRRTELLIILTPRIIRSQEDAEMIKRVEAARMHWCLADVINIHGDGGLRGRSDNWYDGETTVVYPDLEPSVVEMLHAPELPHAKPGTTPPNTMPPVTAPKSPQPTPAPLKPMPAPAPSPTPAPPLKQGAAPPASPLRGPNPEDVRFRQTSGGQPLTALPPAPPRQAVYEAAGPAAPPQQAVYEVSTPPAPQTAPR